MAAPGQEQVRLSGCADLGFNDLMNSRDLVRKFFRRQPVERVPFLLAAFYQASRIDGAPAEELIGEPPRLSRAVIGLSRLLQSDSVAFCLESAVHAACGVDLSWPLADGAPVVADGAEPGPPDADTLLALAAPLLTTIAAAKAELRGEKAVLAAMPGPAMLADWLGGEAAEAGVAAALRALAEAACKAGAEILVIEDDPADEARLKHLAGPIVNTARYYSATVVLSVAQPVREGFADAQLVPADAIDPPPAGALFGLRLTDADLRDPARRKALAGRIAGGDGRIFVSLGDAAMIGREVPEVLSGLNQVLGRS